MKKWYRVWKYCNSKIDLEEMILELDFQEVRRYINKGYRVDETWLRP